MEIADLTSLNLNDVAKGIRALYQSAYSPPSFSYTDDDMDEFEVRFLRHSEFDGFRMLGGVEDGILMAFTYGFTFPNGRWWNGSLESAPDEVAGKSLFGLIELAVSRRYRRRGYARVLHDNLLISRSEDFATLLARPGGVAHDVYPRWGWRQVGRVQSYPDWPIDDVFLLDLPITPSVPMYTLKSLGREPVYALE